MKKRLTILQQIGVALMIPGMLLVICSVDPYSLGEITLQEFFYQVGIGAVLMLAGYGAYKPMGKR